MAGKPFRRATATGLPPPGSQVSHTASCEKKMMGAPTAVHRVVGEIASFFPVGNSHILPVG